MIFKGWFVTPTLTNWSIFALKSMKAFSFIVFTECGNELFQEATFTFDPNSMLSPSTLRQHLLFSLATIVPHSLGAFKNPKEDISSLV